MKIYLEESTKIKLGVIESQEEREGNKEKTSRCERVIRKRKAIFRKHFKEYI